MRIKPALFFILNSSFILSTLAGSATWNTSPASNNWNTPTNWTPTTVPNGPSDVATFATSSVRAISLSADTEVNEIVFEPGASAFMIHSISSSILTVSGTGITNNSDATQELVVDQNDDAETDGLRFINSANVGSNIVITASGGTHDAFGTGAGIFFQDNSSAGDAIINVYGATAHAFRAAECTFSENASAGNASISILPSSNDFLGSLTFFDQSTAGTAVIHNSRSDRVGGEFDFYDTSNAGSSYITNDGHMRFRDNSSLDQATITNSPGSSSNPDIGLVTFEENATAKAGTIVNEGGISTGEPGGVTHFIGSSGAGSSTLIANGGTSGGEGGLILFENRSDGGRARVEVFGNGTLDISARVAPAVHIGSLEGDGNVLLGANNLTIGRNNLSTTFSGLIKDNAPVGSISKLGTGTLTLSGANTYHGQTFINSGTILVMNQSGSGTGTGPVLDNTGTLGGTGIIGGRVTVGTRTGTGASVSPGVDGTGTLTILKTVTFNPDGTYLCEIKSDTTEADQVRAPGLILLRGPRIVLRDLGQSILAAGTRFVVIDNTGTDPISGTFQNLPDGGTVTVGNNTFQANYEGGDGNDLTLTVIQ